jgi:hypothetical protein
VIRGIASSQAKERIMKRRVPRAIAVAAIVVLAACAWRMSIPAAAEPVSDGYSYDATGVTDLRLQLGSGDVLVHGVNDATVTVRNRDAGSDAPVDLRAHWKRTGDHARLTLRGTPKHDVGLVIAVPKTLNIEVGMFAGQIAVRDMLANIHVHVRSGEVDIRVTDFASYASVEGSVTSGAITCPELHVDQGGLLRSFHWTGAGKYVLRAEVSFGSVSFHGTKPRELGSVAH